MRRTILPVLLLSLLILNGCKTMSPENTPSVVSIDSALAAHPNPVHVRRGQWIHFFFPAGSRDLDISADFLDNQGHDGEQAWGRVRLDAPLGEHHYTIVNLAKKSGTDPEVMIDP